MSDAIRFYLDEHISHDIRDALRRKGIDVITPLDVDRVGYTDEDQLAFAHEQGRVIVTHDDDFLRHHSQGVPHAGIAYCAPGKLSTGQMIEILELVYHVYTPEEMHNRVEYL